MPVFTLMSQAGTIYWFETVIASPQVIPVLVSSLIPEPMQYIPRVPAWYPPDAGMNSSSDNPPTYSGTMKRE